MDSAKSWPLLCKSIEKQRQKERKKFGMQHDLAFFLFFFKYRPIVYNDDDGRLWIFYVELHRIGIRLNISMS